MVPILIELTGWWRSRHMDRAVHCNVANAVTETHGVLGTTRLCHLIPTPLAGGFLNAERPEWFQGQSVSQP